MRLPEYVRSCLDCLEKAGFAAYAVGGCVRDSLLGLTPQDYDLCTAAKPETIREIFSDHSLVLAGLKHGTVGVVTEQGVVEITTFRTEGDYRDHRHPAWVAFVEDIHQDLARRDFTVNAMAYSPTRGFADPFGGQADLKNRILRSVGDPGTRFREDALRILRGVRFAVKYRLQPEEATLSAMEALSPLMDTLAAERIFEELCKLLPLVTPEDLLRFTPILCRVIPELVPTVGFAQHTPHHVHDVYTHTAQVTGNVPQELTLRWAALLHDIGKPRTFQLDEAGQGHFYGHAQLSADMANEILLRLKAPTQLRQDVCLLIRQHMTPLTPDKKLLRRRMSQYGPELLRQQLALQEADFGGKGVRDSDPDFPGIRLLMEELSREDACLKVTDLAVNGRDLMALGFSGPAIGQCLNALLQQVLDEQLPNEKEALRSAASAMQAHSRG